MHVTGVRVRCKGRGEVQKLINDFDELLLLIIIIIIIHTFVRASVQFN